MSQTVSVNGVRLVYDDGGQGTAIVTLHGGPGMRSRASDWAAFRPLTDHYRLVSYDQRGNGEEFLALHARIFNLHQHVCTTFAARIRRSNQSKAHLVWQVAFDEMA